MVIHAVRTIFNVKPSLYRLRGRIVNVTVFLVGVSRYAETAILLGFRFAGGRTL